MDSARGRLLVATPGLSDPNFRRTVLLMLEHNEHGALGVVLNRPSRFTSRRVVAPWDDLVTKPKVVFVGGPVSQTSLIALAATSDATTTGAWRPLVSRVGTLDLNAEPDDVPGVAEVRVLAGYAAWSPGQLEMEMSEDSWFVLDMAPADPFTPNPSELWWQVFARQTDPDLRQLRLYPANPRLN